MSTIEDFQDKSLYGDYMCAVLPANAVDISDLREVPDNQEVFAHPQTDQSIIIEILEYVNEPDECAIKTHYEDLAGSNDAAGPVDSQILGIEQIPKGQIAMTQCDRAYMLSSRQYVSKFKESAKNEVYIHIAMFRLPQFETDILVSFNDPANIDPDSSSHAAVPTSVQPWTMEHFTTLLKSLKVLNTEFFG